ncbi:MAG: hypothetical protein FWC38_03800 [Proteobacteria bacterium]|nr:hypothetical protein [Pseudomonadota bacterium]MCL2307351.1 hypothetical protein [Pseudomonadota bacterium]
MSWHDVHVHGFRLASFNEAESTADLVFDIDYILEWKQDGCVFTFVVCPATLCFKDAFDLQFSLDYAKPTAGMCPFSINRIRREQIEFPTGYKSYQWVIEIDWPNGEICFQSPGFIQTLTGSPKSVAEQWLSSELRNNS